MRNPLRSEQEAFEFLLLTLAGFAAIAIASVFGGPWAGVPVFIAVSVGAIFLYFRRPYPDPLPLPAAPVHVGGPNDKRILVIAKDTVGGEELRRCLRERSQGFQ